jgi:sugar lactone lactonase YvrE
VVALENGRIVATADSAGGKKFDRPHDVDVDSEGRVIITDPGNNRLVLFDRDLKVLREIGGEPYNFNEPKYIATAEDGLLVVADEYNNRVILLDVDFKQVGMIGTGKRGDGPGELYKPEGAEVAGRYLWIADTHNHRIQLYKRR